MIVPPLPNNEGDRLKALLDLEILDSDREEDYDELVQLAAHICEIEAAHISLIDKDRQWIKAKVGTLSATVDRNIAFCSHTILQTDALIVEDARLDNRFFDNPFVSQEEGVRFYAGIPLITSEGFGVGSLCVLGRAPRKLRPDQIKALQVLSKQVMKQMELRKTLRLVKQQREKLEQFNETNARLLSIIGHDVRSPLATLSSLMDLTERGHLNADETNQVTSRIKSTLKSAELLLKDLLQWAGTQQEEKSEYINVHQLISQFELDFKHDFSAKQNELINAVPIDAKVFLEKNTLQFVLRNLLMNANKFTERGSISVRIVNDNKHAIIAVQDKGIGIDPQRLQRLFDWRDRRSTEGTQGEKGSGLALLLASDLLKKHGALLQVESIVGEGSTFSVVIPNP